MHIKIKQTIALIILVVILFVGVSYWLLPTGQMLTMSVQCAAKPALLNRILASPELREKWLNTVGKKDSLGMYRFEDCTFSFSSDFFQSTNMAVQYKNIKASSPLTTQATNDSCQASLHFQMPANNSIIGKWKQFFYSKKISHATQKLLQSLANFVALPTNVYGTVMNLATVKDSTLIAIKGNTVLYPTINDIYKQIDKLQKYALQNNAIATNAPMLHILKNGAEGYAYMVALPIDKWLTNNGEIIAKRMLYGGKILETGKIKGGFYTVEQYVKQLEYFRADLNEISPAIPYQLLITNRQEEKDSNKWVTQLYYPVF